jgi:cytochrome c
MKFRQILLYVTVVVAFGMLIVGGWYRSRPDIDIGKRLVTNSCGVCHDLTSSQIQERGPYLWGVYGRPAGTSGFVHSQGFLAKVEKEPFVWDDDHLNLFITNPGQYIPRTEMGKSDRKHPTAFDGIKSAANREDVLAYLKTLR